MVKLLKSKILRIIFSVLLLLLIIIVMIKFIDFQFFFKKIKSVNIFFLFLSFLSLSISYYFRVLRFKLILNEKKGVVLFSISGIHYFLNKILPARTGEITLPLLFKKHLDIEYSKGISALLLFRILDVFAMLILFLFSLFFIDIIKNINLLIVISVFLILLIMFLWGFLNFFSNLLIKITGKISIRSIKDRKEKIENFLYKIKDYKKAKNNMFYLKTGIVSLLSWILVYFYYYFVIMSFELDHSFSETVFASSISNFTFILPINSAGNIGPFEAAWTYGFYLLGEIKDVSLPIGLFANIFATFITSFFALFGYIYLKRHSSIIINAPLTENTPK